MGHAPVSGRAALAGVVAAFAVGAPVAPAQAAPVVDVYSSLPLQGASQSQTRPMVRAMRLALRQAGGRAGAVRVRYTSLDDSTRSAGNWSPSRVTRNARLAAGRSTTVAYIGEFNSGATALALPILNAAGIAQISPTNTYDGLTADAPGTAASEPGRYYPTGVRTFVRLTPRDAVQARAIATLMKRDGCRRVAVADDRETYGAGVAKQVASTTRARGMKVVRRLRIVRKRSYRTEARRTRSARADCFFFGGVTANGGPRLYDAVVRARPGIRLYGADGVCETGTTDRRRGGFGTRAARRFKCTVAVRPLTRYPGGATFARAYRKAYGTRSTIDPYALYGYESMRLVLSTLRRLGPAATDRGRVVAALLATRGRRSPLGTYGFDANGDTTNRRYGVYRVSRGVLRYAGSVRPR